MLINEFIVEGLNTSFSSGEFIFLEFFNAVKPFLFQDTQHHAIPPAIAADTVIAEYPFNGAANILHGLDALLVATIGPEFNPFNIQYFKGVLEH